MVLLINISILQTYASPCLSLLSSMEYPDQFLVLLVQVMIVCSS